MPKCIILIQYPLKTALNSKKLLLSVLLLLIISDQMIYWYLLTFVYIYIYTNIIKLKIKSKNFNNKIAMEENYTHSTTTKRNLRIGINGVDT